jgi:3-oxoacyl-[acyl-carrier-protein] synthase III
MSHAEQHHRKIAIKSATSIAAGYGAEGARFGSLVASREIVSGLRPRRKPRTGRGLSQPAEDLPASWLESLLGFESIATTHATRAAAAATVASGLGWGAAGKALRGSGFNADVEAMTAQAIDGALRQYEQQRQGRPVARASSIQGHVHISATSSVRTPYALLEARRAAGCHKPGLPIWNLLSGCSGVLFALQQARVMLETEEAARDEDAFVVISCDNDLLPFVHTRGRCPVDRDENIDDWLFQAIFGEGAGAIVVGHADRAGGDWVLEDMGWSAVADDWRVTMSSDDGAPRMIVRAREVAATFREHVPQVAKRGLQALGMTSFRELHRLCVHESNPKLVAHIASRLEAPSDIVHSISARVGTLAAVSAFTLLDEALAAHRAGADPGRDAIVCALIGEAGNSVVAGHLALRYAQAQPRVAAA